MKNVLVSGCGGKMGKTVCNYISNLPGYKLVAGVDPKHCDAPLSKVAGIDSDIIVCGTMQEGLASAKVDVVIDFTAPSAVVGNAITCLDSKTPILIGTTGISSENMKMLDELAQKNKTAIMIVPNFAIGAILMMNFAKIAAKFMKKAEIIELHHDQKVDKPSGTAIKTRKGMLEAIGKLDEENNPDVIPMHSVRLPGLVAHQEVIFGDLGQTLTIRHDTINRDCFMPGIAMALSQMDSFIGLRTGIDINS